MQQTKYVKSVLNKIETFYQKRDDENKGAQNQENFRNKPQTQLLVTKPQVFFDKQLLKYMQNLEKRLNEITAQSFDQKKSLTDNFKKQDEIPEDNNEHHKYSTKVQTRTHIDEPTKQRNKGKNKKMRLCRQFVKTGLCRLDDKCPHAHQMGELDVEYLPSEWVQQFVRKTKVQNIMMTSLRAQSSQQSLRPKSSFIFHIVASMVRTQLPPNQPNTFKIIDKRGKTNLIQSVQNQDLGEIFEQLAAGADPTYQDWSGTDSIIHAIKLNNIETISIILDFEYQKPIFLNKKFFCQKQTYLIMAAKQSYNSICAKLIDCGADPNITDFNNKSALFYSVEHNDIDTVKLLIEYGANCNIIDDFNKTVGDYAFKNRQLQILQLLFKNGGGFSDFTKRRLLLLIMKDKQLLFFAAQNNLISLLNEIIKRGFSTNELDENGNNILLLAYKSQYFDTVISLVQELNLISLITVSNNSGENLLILSIKEGRKEMAKFFINLLNQSVNFSDRYGKTPLIYAAEHGYHDLVAHLLTLGADVNIVDKSGRPALTFAAKNQNLLVVETILNSKAFINVLWRDQFDMTARNYAKNPSIKALISEYMIETRQFSDSLIQELEDQELNIDKFVKPRNSGIEQQAHTLHRTGSIRRSLRHITKSSAEN